MIFVILAAAAVPIGSLLWIDHRACRRRMYYAAPVIPGDDAVAAYCEQYVVCDDDVETVCDDYQGGRREMQRRPAEQRGDIG